MKRLANYDSAADSDDDNAISDPVLKRAKRNSSPPSSPASSSSGESNSKNKSDITSSELTIGRPKRKSLSNQDQKNPKCANKLGTSSSGRHLSEVNVGTSDEDSSREEDEVMEMDIVEEEGQGEEGEEDDIFPD